MKTLSALLLLIATNPLAAQETDALQRWYDVELIVVQNLDFERNNTETWPPTGRLPDYTSGLDIYSSPEESRDPQAGTETGVTTATIAEPPVDTTDIAGFPYPEPFSIPEEEASLAGVLGSLRRSRNFRPLLHMSWTQPPLDRGEAQAVRIYVPDEPEEDVVETLDAKRTTVFSDLPGSVSDPQLNDEGELILEAEFLPDSLFDPDKINLRRPIDGTATLIVSRFLHLYLDIVFLPTTDNAPGNQADSLAADHESKRRVLTQRLAAGEITLEQARQELGASVGRDFYGFRLDQSRRMRNGEIHYFDHPAFSVIALIEPREFELPEQDSNSVSATVLQQPNQ